MFDRRLSLVISRVDVGGGYSMGASMVSLLGDSMGTCGSVCGNSDGQGTGGDKVEGGSADNDPLSAGIKVGADAGGAVRRFARGWA